MTKTIQNAIDSGTPEFRAYAEYVLDSMPDVSVPVLREMFKHNASVSEYRAHMQRIGGEE